jgi:hypothetical protein
MKKYQNLSKDEAKILLMSQSLSANLWYMASDDLKKDIIRFPDPSFMDSQSWPDYKSKNQDENLLSNVLNNPEQGSSTPEEPAKKVHQVSETKSDLAEEEMISNNEVLVKRSASSEESTKPEKQIAKQVDTIKNNTLDKKSARNKKTSKTNKESSSRAKLKKPRMTELSEPDDFYAWLEQMNPIHPGSPKMIKGNKKALKPVKRKVSEAQQKVNKSLVLSDEIVSETLAKLLVRQGHKEKAIEMYEKLILKYPEKVATFAAALQKLKS